MSIRWSLLLATLIAGVVVACWPEPDENSCLTEAATRLQTKVNDAHQVLEHSTAEVARRTSAANSAELWKLSFPRSPAVFIVLRHGRAVLWNGRVPVTGATLAGTEAGHLDLDDGVYLHTVAQVDSTQVHGLQRVWAAPVVENRYLQRRFEVGFISEEGIAAEVEPGMGPVVRDAQGAIMFRLVMAGTDAAIHPAGRVWSALLLIALFVATLWAFSSIPGRPWTSVALFCAPLIVARALSLLWGPWAGLAGIPLFDPSFFGSSFLMPSLGDLAVDVVLLLCMIAFFRVRLRSAPAPPHSFFAATVGAAVLFAASQWIDSVLISLVRDSRVSLDLFHIQGFDLYSWVALASVSLLLLAWGLLADVWVRWTFPHGRWKPGLLLVLVFSIALLGIHYAMDVYDTVLALWPGVFLLLLRSSHHERYRFLSAVLLVAAPAALTAHVLNRETLKRTANERLVLAEVASTREDPVIELLFKEAVTSMDLDAALSAWLDGAYGPSGRRGTVAPCSSMELDRLVRQAFLTGYWDRYDVRLHLFTASGTPLCSTSPDAPPTWEQLRARAQQGVPTAGDTLLRSVHRPGEEALYLGQIDLPTNAPRHTLVVELRPRLMPDALGFPELLLAGDQAAERRLDRYARARYERGALTESIGTYAFPIAWHEPVPDEGTQLIDGNFDLLALGDVRSTLVVLGMRIPSRLDHFTTFSYLFTLFALLGGIVLLVNTLVSKRGTTRFGIATKLQAGILLFAGISLVLFAMGTRRALEARSEQRAVRAMKDRSRGVINELRQTLRGESQLTAELAPYLDHLLTRFSNIFYTDLSLYTPDGTLLATSREQVFNTGLMDRRMDAAAYRELAMLGRESFVQQESIGSARFRASYMPFRNEMGEVLAYLAIPYFARQAESDAERAAGDIAVVNLFTLLFVLSGIAAALITHWTTRPLLTLRKGLERIGLGSRNEPIAYVGNDELGELVRVYNRKVEELRHSAEKLARSERESAWREMARQVAHEIKNPLTPMKLSIQHFQRTWTPSAPDARERLDRFSDNLVEQIDVLSRIAGEFSHFAQMPPAHPSVLDLTEVADAAVHLFADTSAHRVTLHSDGPLLVLADREHVLRMFNNLIKNALQAIPEERQGHVEVLLRNEGAEAVAEVRDNGIGIPAGAIDHVFEPQFTTKSGGMGLGLAMVKRMVEHAGGRVRFSTEEGVGTRFFIALPLHA